MQKSYTTLVRIYLIVGTLSCSLIGPVWGFTKEKTLDYRLDDGVGIRVHYVSSSFKSTEEAQIFSRDVLNAAVSAYQTITQFEGFDTKGFSFAIPDTRYAADPDRVIDIYLGHPSQRSPFPEIRKKNLSFKDAPCFDTIALSNTEFNAIILLPSNYREFIKNWEKMNPSTLGKRQVEADLQGTLIHEMFHALIFYYNKNLNKDADFAAGEITKAKRVDWYVEGLARYFETFAGAKHDFFSQGFKHILPDKVRFSRGGANFYMRYPDQTFVDLRYENALFWRFFEQRYGMEKIEALSRQMRSESGDNPGEAIQKTVGISMPDILKHYALAMLFKDFGLKEHTQDLKEVARTRLGYGQRGFYLNESGNKNYLGFSCRTDQVMVWDDITTGPDKLPIAGDSTKDADVSGWATDFIEIEIEDIASMPSLAVRSLQDDHPLLVQFVFLTRGGSFWAKSVLNDHLGNYELSLAEELEAKGISRQNLRGLYILITNPKPLNTCRYEILSTDAP